MQDYNQAFAYIAALTQGDPASSIVDMRAIHDQDKARPAIPRRGTLPELWAEMVNLNNAGYGIFVNINHMDGVGREISNVAAIRVQAVDLDNLSAAQNYERAIQHNPRPSFAVQSSPGKFHVYWSTQYHTNRDAFTLLQRKLRTLYDGDKTIIDPSRVLRVPGFYHLKSAPHLVTCWGLEGYGIAVNPVSLEQSLAHVNVIDGNGGRHELGDPTLQSPGLDWCIKALNTIDPNDLDRGEWISVTSSFKQAAWNFASEEQLLNIWGEWCSRYTVADGNNQPENMKNWNSIRNTEVGWKALERRSGMKAMRLLGQRIADQLPTQPLSAAASPMPPTAPGVQPPLPLFDGEFLNEGEQKEYFKGCVFIERMGTILTPHGRFMNSTQFNGAKGGKKFIIDIEGKVTDEPWKAATRSTLWTIPKADHIRFLPHRPHGEMSADALGRVGVNTYKPAIVNMVPGDITPFLNHMAALFPSEIDRQILFEYLAHNVKFPGYKIPWAPLIQSTEGAGKNVIKAVMKAAIGGIYTYEPKAKELIESGSKFNAWMRAKLFIIVDEIKTDERRDMIEILKPMISEEQIEIQGKGVDQDLEDNYSNWAFFSNYKDAIPVSKNSRRFAIFYSVIQTADDLNRRGMNSAYFAGLYGWLRAGGDAHVAHWLMHYPIERGAIAMRAPMTTSSVEAVAQSRGPVETLVLDAIADMLPGFRGGWVSSVAVHKRLKGSTVRNVSDKTLGTIMEALGYHSLGRAPRPFIQEDTENRANLWNWDRAANVNDFGRSQNYEV